MKESFYFSHDYNARNDQKILIIRWEYWLEWYALFFMCLESMAEEDRGYIYRGAIAGLWVSYSVAIDRLMPFIEKCIEIWLFHEDKIWIFSPRMHEHKKYRKSLSEQGKKGAEKRWKNSPPISPPNGKERKGKEIKGNNINTNITTNTNISIVKEVWDNTQTFFDILKEFEDKKEMSQEMIDTVQKITGWILEWKELYKFFNYWVETGSSWKQRWKMEKIFEIKRRLQTWKSRITAWFTKQQPQKVSPNKY